MMHTEHRTQGVHTKFEAINPWAVIASPGCFALRSKAAGAKQSREMASASLGTRPRHDGTHVPRLSGPTTSPSLTARPPDLRSDRIGDRAGGPSVARNDAKQVPRHAPPLLLLFLFFFAPALFANNLDVANVTLTDRDSTANTIKVEFDVSWENSWNQLANHDAVWVFVKFSTDSGSTWNHATLKTAGTDPTGFSTGTAQGSSRAISIVVPTDKVGAFLKPASGQGNMDVNDIKLVWDYDADGVADSDTVRVQVHGIEMVYIPTASFYIGDGNGSTESICAFHTGTGNSAVQITATLKGDIRIDPLTCADDSQLEDTGIGIDGDGGLDTDDNGTIDNASFPTGYTAFYLMKHELTEGQWVEFFNTLTSAQKTNRDITGNDTTFGQGGKNSDSWVDRNTVSWTSGDAATSRADRAIAWLSWQDGAAYADWAGLRPMTELEFEKAARGPKDVTLNEFAWGTTTINTAQDLSGGAEDGTETVTNPKKANNVHTPLNKETPLGGDCDSTAAKCDGPVRVGIFANQSPHRERAGGGYYGNMELSGNVEERIVTVGNSTGRSFQGTHGDGVLTTTTNYEGFATNTDWPGIAATTARGVIGGTGAGLRGGSWNRSDANYTLRTSNRSNAAYTDGFARSNERGFRAARTAP